MKSSAVFIIAFALFGTSHVQAQTVDIGCNYIVVSGSYTCEIVGLTVGNNPNANFVISGQHMTGRSNGDVRAVSIMNSKIPFVISRLFTVFPNLLLFSVENGGLTQIQANAFIDAGRLRVISIKSNPNLQTIDELAFSVRGVSLLLSLSLVQNQIRQLPVNVFKPLTALNSLSISQNLLESLDGLLLSNNMEIESIEIQGNQIHSIGKNFIDNLPQLRQLYAADNLCVDSNWTVGASTTIETIRQGLNVCFENSIRQPENELRRFIIELRGPLSLRFENGTEIVRV